MSAPAKSRRCAFVICTLAAIVLTVAFLPLENCLKDLAARTFSAQYLIFRALFPIVIAVLFFFKLILQRRMPASLSLWTDLIGIVLLLIGIAVWCRPLSPLFLLIGFSPVFTVFFCLQVCALIYDLATWKKRKAP